MPRFSGLRSSLGGRSEDGNTPAEYIFSAFCSASVVFRQGSGQVLRVAWVAASRQALADWSPNDIVRDIRVGRPSCSFLCFASEA